MYYKVICRKPSAVWVGSQIIDDKIDPNYNNALYIEDLDYKYRKINYEIKYNREIIDELTDYTANGSFGWLKQNVIYTDDNGIPFIRIKNITEDGFNFEDLIYITTESYNKLKKSQLNGGELLFSKTGSVGVTLVVPSNINKMSLADNIFKVTYKSNIDTYYIDAFFKSYYGKLWVKRLSQGGVQQTIIKNSFREIQIPIPSPEIQKYIGDMVRKAEELREEAKRLKKEAEEIINESLNFKQLDLLYKGSKVKFKWISTNVLTDRIDGNYYEQKYVETINHIKRNSKKYITLNSIIDSIYTGKKPMYDEKGTEAYFVQSGNISSNFLEIDNKEKVDLSKYNQVLFGDLLIAKDGETIGKIAINLTNEIIIINEHTYCVRLKEKYKYYSAYIYYLLINDYINPLIRREATGSAQKGLNFSFAENIIIPILEEDIIMNLYNLELRRCNNIYKSKQLIQEAKQDVEDLIEGNFDMSKVRANS